MLKITSVALALIGIVAFESGANAYPKAVQASIIFNMRNEMIGGRVVPRFVPGSLASRRNDVLIRNVLHGWR